MKALEKGPSNMEEIAREVASQFGVEESELYRQHASCRGVRSVFMELCCLYLSMKMKFYRVYLKE